MSGIRLSEKHGVNPCIPVCFFCGKEKNEIALLGKLKGDIEAPRNAIFDLIPCDECKQKFEGNFVVIEAEQDARRNPHPSGRWVCIKKEAAEKMFNHPDAIKRGVAFMEPELYSKVFGDY